MLARADPECRIGPRFFLDREQFVADFLQRVVPTDLLPFAAGEFHRILEAMLAVTVFADRRALGAVRTEIERRIEHRLLADPYAVLHHGIDRAADRAMRANRAFDFDLAATRLPRGAGL